MKNTVLLFVALFTCILTELIAAQGSLQDIKAIKDGQAKLKCTIPKNATKCEFVSISSDGTSNVLLTSYSPEKVNVPFEKTGVMMTLEDDLPHGRCTLIFDNVQPEISGSYACYIADIDNNKQEYYFQLAVLAMPTLTEIFYNDNVIPNGTMYVLPENGDDNYITITLEVRAERGIPAADGLWKIDGHFVSSNTVVLYEGLYKTTVSRVTFHIWQDESKPERSLTYSSVHKIYPGGESFRTISIGYSYPTRHAEIKKDYFQLPDEAVTQLTCIADGIPKPSVEWQFAAIFEGPFEDYTENLPQTELKDQINVTYSGFYRCCAKNIKNDVCVTSRPVEANGKPLVMPTPSEIFFNGIPIKNGSDFALPNNYANKFITLETRAEHGFPAAQAEWVIVGHLGEYDVDTTIVDADMGLKTTVSNVTFEISKEETRPERTVIFISRHPLYLHQQIVQTISIGYPRATSKSEIVNQIKYSTGKNDELTLLTCVADGLPKPAEFIWEYAVNFNGNYELFTDMITASELKDEITTTVTGFYRCLAKNHKNVDWVKSLSVEVKGKSVLRNKPSIFSLDDVKLNANNRYQIDDTLAYEQLGLRCKVPATNTKPIIRWDSKPTGTEFTVKETEKTDDGKMYSSTLLTNSINPFEVKPERTFICVVKSANEILTDMVTVGFKYKTTNVRSFSSSEVVSKGTRGKLLYCKADGIPEPIFQWRKKINDEFVDYKTGAHVVVSDPGIYQCFARNDVNEPFEWIKSVNDDFAIL